MNVSKKGQFGNCVQKTHTRLQVTVHITTVENEEKILVFNFVKVYMLARVVITFEQGEKSIPLNVS